MQVEIQGPSLHPTGYGQLTRAVRKGLEQIGVTIAERAPAMLGIYPAFGLWNYWKGQYKAMLTMWETTKLPEVTLEKLDNFDLVLVPTKLNVEQFSREHPNVQRINFGIDSDLWFPRPRKVQGELRFLHIRGNIRKGYDTLEKAWAIAFPDPSSLSPTPILYTPRFQNAPDYEVAQAFYDSHVYVAPSRGEGWHLPPFQMLATGAPVILSDIPGHTEWNHLPGCLTIPTHEVPSPIGGTTPAWSGYWWDTDPIHLAQALLKIYNHYSSWSQAAQDGARIIARSYTLADTARAIWGHLEGKGGPVEPVLMEATTRLFPIVCSRRVVDASIGQHTWNILPGVETMVPSDVKRVLGHAGYLAEDCWDPKSLEPRIYGVRE